MDHAPRYCWLLPLLQPFKQLARCPLPPSAQGAHPQLSLLPFLAPSTTMGLTDACMPPNASSCPTKAGVETARKD